MKKVQRLIPVFFHPWCYSENFSAFQHHPVSHTYDFHLHSLLQFLTETVEWEWLDLNRWPGFLRKCYFSRLKSEFLKYVLWMCLKLNVKGHLWWWKKSFLFICFQSMKLEWQLMIIAVELFWTLCTFPCESDGEWQFISHAVMLLLLPRLKGFNKYIQNDKWFLLAVSGFCKSLRTENI